jgi:hypothetical protein
MKIANGNVSASVPQKREGHACHRGLLLPPGSVLLVVLPRVLCELLGG